jgi:hypothetical protein
MNTERTPRSDKELWRSLASQLPVAPVSAPAAPSEMDLAAWLEGRLSEDEAASIEAAVASDSALRRAALDLADIRGKPLPAPPERLVVRARALVGFEAEGQAPSAGLIRGWLFGRRRYALQQGVMAVAAVAIATGGFMVGGGLGESLARQGEGYSATETASISGTASNEVSEFFAGDGI